MQAEALANLLIPNQQVLILPEGSFGISEAGAREALTNRIESQTGIPANLPEGGIFL